MTRPTEQIEVTGRPGFVCISWRSIAAGLVTVIALVWIMSLLGTAVGMSIADGTDGEALGAGLGYGVIAWMLFSGLVAFFIGGMVAARVSGFCDAQNGMLHGLTLWSSAVVTMLLLGVIGFTSFINTGSSIVRSAVTASSIAADTVSLQGRGAADEIGGTSVDSSDILTANIAARLKRFAANILAEAGDSEVSPERVRQAIDELDTRTLQDAGAYLLAGETQAAKDILAVQTRLSQRQVDALVDGVQADVKNQIDEFRAQAEQTIETATTYAQGVLWTAFVAALLGLVISIIGGMLGAASVDRIRLLTVNRQS